MFDFESIETGLVLKAEMWKYEFRNEHRNGHVFNLRNVTFLIVGIVPENDLKNAVGPVETDIWDCSK